MLQQNKPDKLHSKIPRPVFNKPQANRIRDRKNLSTSQKRSESSALRPPKKDDTLLKDESRPKQQNYNGKGNLFTRRHVQNDAFKVTNDDGKKKLISLEGGETEKDNLFESLAEEQRQQFKNEFQPDDTALESILSNKGITTNLSTPSSRSTLQTMQVPSVKRSSIYFQYQSSRLSMMESHDLFKEKMKLLKENMKSMNIKVEATPSNEKVKTPSSSSVRPVNIYHKLKPRDNHAVSKGDVTPVDSKKIMIKNISMSERKELHHPDLNFDKRLCFTSSKPTPELKHSASFRRDKENKCRFKLFSSPINEIPESNEHISCSSLVKKQLSDVCISSSSENLGYRPAFIEDGESKKELFFTEQAKSLWPINRERLREIEIPKQGQTESAVFTPMVAQMSCSTTSTSSSANKCAVSTPTHCTGSIHRPISSPIPVDYQQTTPTLQKNQTPTIGRNKKYTPIITHTPSRSARKTESLNKAPQRTPVVVSVSDCRTPKCLSSAMQGSGRGNTDAPFLCSYLKKRLESGH